MARVVAVEQTLRAESVWSSADAVFIFFEEMAVARAQLCEDGTVMARERGL